MMPTASIAQSDQNTLSHMAEVKVFAENAKGQKLVGDSRYVMTDQELYDDIVAWCHENNIKARTVNTEAWSQMIFRSLLWRVDNINDRTLFALRWTQ
jgi:hypothetical protein